MLKSGPASEASSLVNYIASWSFIICVVVWYDVLFKTNKTSKMMQSPEFAIDTLERELQANEDFLQRYRETGFESAITNAREIAEDMEVNTTFPETRNRCRKAHFDYECADEMDKFTPEQRLKQIFLQTSGSGAGVSSVTVPADQGLEQHFRVSLSFRHTHQNARHRSAAKTLCLLLREDGRRRNK